VVNFGASGDNSTLNTAAIRGAIETANAAGGGVVYFPPGDFLTGTIILLENVSLHLEAGATIWGSTKREDYQHGCLVYAEDADNIAIRGRGTINANGKSFWTADGKGGFAEENERIRAQLDSWRPGRMMRFIRCDDLMLEDVILKNSPAWTIHPIDCIGVTIRGISIINGIYDEDGPNTDGINPDGCSRVRISDCYLQCGDDCIVFKITNREGGNKVCRDIVVTNCVLTTTETAIKIGSESHGEFRNMTISNCTIHDSGCGIGLWMRDGGLIDGWKISNISMDLTRLRNGGQPIYLWSYRRTDDTPWGTVRNVTISNMTAIADGGIFVSGIPEQPIEGLTLENIRIFMRGERKTEWHVDPPLPFYVWGHHRAPHDIFIRHAKDVTLRNVRLTWNTPEQAEWGAAIRAWNVEDLDIDGFIGRQTTPSDEPAIWLRDVKRASIRNCLSPENTGTFVKLDSGTEDVMLMNNDLSRVKKTAEFSKGVRSSELFESGNRQPRNN
jgi:hypothetical protein